MGRFKVIFSHGQESGPWGTKIQRLAVLAEGTFGAVVESIDYRGLGDPDDRVVRLVARLDELAGAGASEGSGRAGVQTRPDPIVLVGSSMGGYVALMAAAARPVVGVFLMAPALYMPGYACQDPPALDCPVTLVHGDADEIIPPGHIIRYAAGASCDLHLIPGDHRLASALEGVLDRFEGFLDGLGADRVPIPGGVAP